MEQVRAFAQSFSIPPGNNALNLGFSADNEYYNDGYPLVPDGAGNFVYQLRVGGRYRVLVQVLGGLQHNPDGSVLTVQGPFGSYSFRLTPAMLPSTLQVESTLPFAAGTSMWVAVANDGTEPLEFAELDLAIERVK